MKYIFYDTETTGTSAPFDQILQFAALLTDDQFNIIESFDIRGRLLSHIIPSPGALLVTGVSVREIRDCRFSHFDMVRQIHEKMEIWSKGGATFIGWNSLKFDENFLRQSYYQTLLPIYQTNTNGNRRADAMRMAQTLAACRPNSLAVPMSDSGKQTFKLGLFAAANGINLEGAHEALADTTATLDLAKLMATRCPDIWTLMLENADARLACNRLQTNSILALAENYFGNQHNFVIAPISANFSNPKEWAVFDLQFDPSEYLYLDDRSLLDAIVGKQKIIRRVPANSQPNILPLELAPSEIRGGRLADAIYVDRANLISGSYAFKERVSQILAERYEDLARPATVEESIFSGFASKADQARMMDFHTGGWTERAQLARTFDDERFKELALRIVAEHCPSVLSVSEIQHFEIWRRNRLFTDKSAPWLTVTKAREELSDLRRSAGVSEMVQLAELENFLDTLAA